MWQVLALAWLVAVGSISPAQAQAQAQPQTKKELVAKVLQLQQAGIANMGQQLAAQTSQRYLQAAGQAVARLPADKREAAARDVQAEVKKFYDEVEPLLRKRATELAPATLSPLYEERFNEEELKQVIAWLESPVSKKWQQAENELANMLAQKVMTDSRPTIEPKAKALEASLARRLGIPAAASGGAAASTPKK